MARSGWLTGSGLGGGEGKEAVLDAPRPLCSQPCLPPCSRVVWSLIAHSVGSEVPVERRRWGLGLWLEAVYALGDWPLA